MTRAAFTVPPELRRLRAAWAWAQSVNRFAASTAAKCGRMVEEPQPQGCYTMAGRTETGGGVSVSIGPAVLHLVRVENTPVTIRLPLPADLQAAVPGMPGGRP